MMALPQIPERAAQQCSYWPTHDTLCFPVPQSLPTGGQAEALAATGQVERHPS